MKNEKEKENEEAAKEKRIESTTRALVKGVR